MDENKILDIKNLKVSFDMYAGEVQALRGVSFHVNKGETLAIVGESGCGKSVTVQTIMKLIPMPPGRIKTGEIIYCGNNIVDYENKKMKKLRGKEMSMIFQDPMSSLNPTMKIGKQISEGLKKHTKLNHNEIKVKVIELLNDVGISDAEKNINRYPHMFSGGMRQRVMIAISLACSPKILFADEPTTALDVTTQAQILDLMNQLKEKYDTSIVLITHDLGIVARMADRISVMYAGKIVESGTSDDIFYNPKHPYTLGLLESIPKKGKKKKIKLDTIQGNPPDLLNIPTGCSFYPRCRYCMDICKDIEPPEIQVEGNHTAQCWLLDERAPKVEEINSHIKTKQNKECK